MFRVQPCEVVLDAAEQDRVDMRAAEQLLWRASRARGVLKPRDHYYTTNLDVRLKGGQEGREAAAQCPGDVEDIDEEVVDEHSRVGVALVGRAGHGTAWHGMARHGRAGQAPSCACVCVCVCV